VEVLSPHAWAPRAGTARLHVLCQGAGAASEPTRTMPQGGQGARAQPPPSVGRSCGSWWRRGIGPTAWWNTNTLLSSGIPPAYCPRGRGPASGLAPVVPHVPASAVTPSELSSWQQLGQAGSLRVWCYSLGPRGGVIRRGGSTSHLYTTTPSSSSPRTRTPSKAMASNKSPRTAGRRTTRLRM
jgi:hypothetical protein